MSKCSICNIKIKSIGLYPWDCNHISHYDCINKYKKPCLLCNSKLKINDSRLFYFSLGETNNLSVTIATYSWNKELCNNSSIHKIIFSEYGMIGTCSCGCIQYFKWKH